MAQMAGYIWDPSFEVIYFCGFAPGCELDSLTLLHIVAPEARTPKQQFHLLVWDLG